MDPNYQSPDEIVNIISGKPEVIAMYFLAKIIKKSSTRINVINVKVNIIKSFKDAELPSIYSSRIVDPYYLYKIDVSSSVRKF